MHKNLKKSTGNSKVHINKFSSVKYIVNRNVCVYIIHQKPFKATEISISKAVLSLYRLTKK